MAKIKQIVWFDQDTMIHILTIAKEAKIAENQVIAYIIQEALKNEEFIKNVIAKLQEKTQVKGIIYQCHLCQRSFYSQNDLVKHLYTHIQPKQ